MHSDKPIAIIGAGLGGLVVGALLQRRGYSIRIFEQSSEFTRLGAGINLSPNVMKVLRAIGAEQRLLDIGIRPLNWISRDLRSGEVMFEYPMRDAVEAKFGAPYITIHRGDFHEVLVDAVAPGTIEFGKRMIALEQRTDTVRVEFEHHACVEADFVIGADGINSMVREILLGPALPTYTGYVAHRSIFPVSRLGGLEITDLSKWWSEDTRDDRHIVVYFLDQHREEVYFVTGVPQPVWESEESFVEAELDELRAAYEGCHPHVLRLVEACPSSTKWALFERDPLPLWSSGRVVLLGDACHPMKPHMAQGAAIAIEDAAVLTRCLEHCGDDLEAAFGLYEASRKDRASLVQKHSRENKWMRQPMDPSWVFGYDALKEKLA
jgi:6-hydroxynicotinate 3-monooxygenase